MRRRALDLAGIALIIASIAWIALTQPFAGREGPRITSWATPAAPLR